MKKKTTKKSSPKKQRQWTVIDANGEKVVRVTLPKINFPIEVINQAPGGSRVYISLG